MAQNTVSQNIDELIATLMLIKTNDNYSHISQAIGDQTKRLTELYNICESNKNLCDVINKSAGIKYTIRSYALNDYLPGNILIYFPECLQYVIFNDAHGYERFVKLWLETNFCDSDIKQIHPQQIVLTSEPQKLVFFYTLNRPIDILINYIQKYLHSPATYIVKDNICTIKVQKHEANNFLETKQIFDQLADKIRNAGDSETACNMFIPTHAAELNYKFNIYNVADSIKQKIDELDILNTLGTPSHVVFNVYINNTLNTGNIGNNTHLYNTCPTPSERWIQRNPPNNNEGANDYYNRYKLNNNDDDQLSIFKFKSAVISQGYKQKRKNAKIFWILTE